MSISASEARQRLFPLLEQVNADHQPVRITSRAGDAVLMSADDYDSWQETVYLLCSPEKRQAADGSRRPGQGRAVSACQIDRRVAGVGRRHGVRNHTMTGAHDLVWQYGGPSDQQS
jgi:antitoxin YefM